MSAPARRVATPSQTVGPFFHFALATDPSLGRMATPEEGERIWLRVRVLDGDARPVPDALVEIYQPDASGRYAEPAQRARFTGFGRLPTRGDGTCAFDTIRPGAVVTPDGRRQAPHTTVCLFARGLLRHVYTRIYFEGDPFQDEDPVLALVPAARRATLLARHVETMAASPGSPETPLWEFVLRLQGNGETVFFDI